MIHTKLKTIAAALLALFLFLCSGALNTRAVAFAASEGSENVGSDILDDLYTDSNFDLNAYPVDEKDYSLQIIQIAESKQGELLVYVYNPCAFVRELTATSINMSLQDRGDKSASWDIYELEPLSVYDVFAKYRVKGFKLSSEPTRYYNIASIFRLWHEDIDDGLDKYIQNTITEVAFRVAQCWTVYQDGEGVRYDMVTSEVITVTEQVINKIRVGIQKLPAWAMVFTFLTNSWAGADCFYLAFNTDMPIDKLIEAELSYDVKHFVGGMGEIVGDELAGSILDAFGKENNRNITNRKALVKHTDVQTVEVSAFEKKHAYTFKDRILSVADFIEQEKTLSENALRELDGKQWVLRFDELAYEEYFVLGMPYYSRNTIENETLLRLEFETDGVPYNLGVVDNKQSSSTWKPPAKEDTLKPSWSFNFFEYIWSCIVKLFNGTANTLEIIVAVVTLVVAVVLLGLVLSLLGLIYPSLKTVFTVVLKAVLWVITLPFRLIGLLFKKKGKKDQNE